MTLWVRLEQGLAARTDEPAIPAAARRAGVLALLSSPAAADACDGDDPSLLLTRRRDGLPRHGGQISFPGGRVESGETARQAALREAAEECAVQPATVTVLGQLPTFYIPPSRYWMTVVVGRWDRPHPLEPDPGEVAAVVTVRLSQLREPDRWRVTELPERGTAWAWELDDGHLLWGATAIATAALLDIVDPEWNRGYRAEDLGPARTVRPWDPTFSVPEHR